MTPHTLQPGHKVMLQRCLDGQVRYAMIIGMATQMDIRNMLNYDERDKPYVWVQTQYGRTMVRADRCQVMW